MASFYWCETCRRVYPAGRIESGRCPNDHDDLISVGRFGGMIKGFIAAGGLEERSEAQTRHRQLIHALWSRDERDQQFYQLLTPPTSFSRFVKRMDELHLRGVDEGWIGMILPDSPFDPEALRHARDTVQPLLAEAANGMRAVGGFTEPEQWRFDWQRSYTREEWLDQLPTLGTLTQLSADKLAEVLDGVGTAVDAIGGSFTMQYTTVAVTAVRTSAT